jgi:hypothetical protein
MAVTLDHFRSAAKTGGKIRFVDGDERKGLHATGSRWKFWQVSSRKTLRGLAAQEVARRNRETAEAFVGLIRNRYGPSGLGLANARLRERIDRGKPLRGRDVNKVLRNADRMLRDNIRYNEAIAGRICADSPRDEYGFGQLLADTPFDDAFHLDEEVRRTLRSEDIDRIRDELRRYLLENREAGDGGRNRLDIDHAYHRQARPKLRVLAILNQNSRIRELFSGPGQAGYKLVFDEVWNESNMPRDLDPSGIDFSRLPGKVLSAIDALVTDPEGVFRPVSAEEARHAAGEEIRSFLTDLNGRLAGIEGAFEGGRIAGPGRDALREIALRCHDAPCDPWTVLERTGNDWTGRGRLAELILEIMGDPPENRDRAEQVLTAAALLVNGRGEILGNGIDGGPITPAGAWRGVFGGDMPADVNRENYAWRMTETAVAAFSGRMREMPAIEGRIGGNDEEALRNRFKSGTILSDIPFRTLMDRIGGYNVLDIRDFTGPQHVEFSRNEIADTLQDVRKDFHRFGSSCRFVVERGGEDPFLTIDPVRRLMTLETGSREFNDAAGDMADELVRAVRELSANEKQALTACRFFTQASFGHYLFASDAMGLLTRGYDWSQVEVRRGPNGTDLLIDIVSAAGSPVAFHMTARVDPEGACRIEAFDLARNLRQDASLFRTALLNELNELTDPKTVLRGDNLASKTFRELFAGLGRNYLETLGREVMGAVTPLLEHPPAPEDLRAVQEHREGIAAAILRVIAGSVNRMPPGIRGILADARQICDRYAGRFENIWRSVIENMIVFRGIVPLGLVPITLDLRRADPVKGDHFYQAIRMVERCLAGRFPDAGTVSGELEAMRDPAEGFLDAVSGIWDH